MDGYSTSNSEAGWFKYNEFGNGISFSSLKDWEALGETQFKGDYTVQVWKNANASNKISLSYIGSNGSSFTITSLAIS